MRKLWTIILILAIVICFLSACTAQNNDFCINDYIELYRNIINSQNEYLLSLQHPSGAFCKWSEGLDNNTITPYFACFVVLALLENPSNSDIVKSYCDWHFSALNTDKDINILPYTIYDYNIINGIITPSYTYDSTDSYAALFLMVLARYYQVKQDIDYIFKHKTQINGIVSVISATRNGGLNYAKTDYNVKFLMDNCEVYAGLEAAEELYLALCDNDKSAYVAQLKNETKAAINSKLYNNNAKLYFPYEGAKKIDKNKLYPDMAAQLYPVIFGVTSYDCKQSTKVYKTFKKKYGRASALQQADTFPWLIVAYAAFMYGDYAFATELLSYAYNNYMPSRTYPWYAMESAMAFLTANKLLSTSHK